MRVFLLLATLCLPAYAAAKEVTAEDACNQMKPALADLQQQLPMAVDYMTTLTGTQVIWVNKKCLLNYNYIVNTGQFLKDMADANNLSDEDNFAFLKTEEGISAVQHSFAEIAKKAAGSHFSVFIPVKDMKITYTHIFDNAELPTVVSAIIDNTK